jgi:hypothetical protein
MMSFHSGLLWSAHSLKPILAYLDPGTGSYLIQILLASLLGFILIFRNQWKRVWLFIKNLPSKLKKKE